MVAINKALLSVGYPNGIEVFLRMPYGNTETLWIYSPQEAIPHVL